MGCPGVLRVKYAECLGTAPERPRQAFEGAQTFQAIARYKGMRAKRTASASQSSRIA